VGVNVDFHALSFSSTDVIQHLKDGAILSNDEKKALSLAKKLSHIPDSDIKALDSRSFKQLEKSLSQIQRIFSSQTGTITIPLNQTDALADLFLLVQSGAVVLTDDQVKSIYEHLVIDHKNLSRDVIDEIVASCGKDTRFNVSLNETTQVNQLLLANHSEPFSTFSFGGTEIREEIPQDLAQIIKSYVEKGELPSLDDFEEDALIDHFYYLDAYLFPTAILDHFLKGIINKAGLLQIKENPDNYPPQLELLASIENPQDLEGVQDLCAYFHELALQRSRLCTIFERRFRMGQTPA
jgi:hypothetical protein